MKRLFLFSALLFCLVGCEDFLDDVFSGSGNLGGGNSDLTGVTLGYEQEMEDFAHKSKKKKVQVVPLTDVETFSSMQMDSTSLALYAAQLGYTSLSPEEMEKFKLAIGMGERCNPVSYDNESYTFVVSFKPTNARVNSIALSVTDTTLLKISRIQGENLKFKFEPLGVGECDINLVVDGNNRIEKTYHVKITSTLTLKVFADAFWLGGTKGRLKYRCKSLPRNVRTMYLAMEDSVTVIGKFRKEDVLAAEPITIVRDTTTFAAKSHTDQFRKNKRRLLRNVSSAVRKYNSQYTGNCRIWVDEKHNETRWIQRSYETEQIILSMNVLSNNPYLLFDIVMKKNQSGADTDDDEDDENDGDNVDDEEVKNYFRVEFNKSMEAGRQQSLRDTLNYLVDKYPTDSLKWVLDF